MKNAFSKKKKKKKEREISPNAICFLCRHMTLNWGAKLGMVPEDQLSILQASALNSSMMKASLFYWLKRKDRNPRTIILFSLSISICKSGGKTSLDHIQAIRVEQASTVALSDFGHALLPHLISWESICACSSREGSQKLNWVICSEMGFIFHRWPQRCWMELLTAHHTSCPWVSILADSRDMATGAWLRWQRQVAAGSVSTVEGNDINIYSMTSKTLLFSSTIWDMTFCFSTCLLFFIEHQLTLAISVELACFPNFTHSSQNRTNCVQLKPCTGNGRNITKHFRWYMGNRLPEWQHHD